jgi:hypothetical protein
MTWELVLDNYYPDAETYRGPATEFHTEWNSLTGWFDWSSLTEQILINVTTTFQQVKPLEAKVWRQYEVWNNIPYYHYNMKFYAHDSPIEPATMSAILSIIYVAVIAVAAWVILNSAKELIWGPSGLPILPIAIAVLVIVYAYSKFKEIYKDKKKR